MRQHTTQSIRNLLDGDWKAVRRGIMVLHNYGQRRDEQRTKQARYRNRRGFSAATAKRGTELARKFNNGTYLTRQDWADALHICKVHARQLAKVANSRGNL
jgi:hypothetical protein